MFVTRAEQPDGKWAAKPRTDRGLLLEPLDRTGPHILFEMIETESADRTWKGDTYRRLLVIQGAWTGEPSHAVFAEWQVADPAQADAFVESRRQLFELRRRVLPTFAADWLLQRVDDASRYLVLGLYGDEAGLRLCRDHPEIRRFTEARPASAYAAQDVSGLRFFRIRR